jgi:hypothetical protein
LKIYFEKEDKPLKDFSLIINIGDGEEKFEDRYQIESFLINFFQDFFKNYTHPKYFSYKLNEKLFK